MMDSQTLLMIILFALWAVILFAVIIFYYSYRRKKKVTRAGFRLPDRNMNQSPRAQKLPVDTQRHLQQIIDTMDIIVFSIDTNRKFTLSEGRGLRKLGLATNDVVGKTVSDIYGDHKDILESIEKAFTGEEIQKIILVNDRVYDCYYNPLFKKDQIIGVTGIALDITERYRAEEGLRESEERFQTLADNIPGVIYLCHNDSRYSMVYTNPRISELTGYSKKEFEDGDIHLADLIHPDDRAAVAARIDENLLDGNQFNLIYRIKHKDGSWRWVSEIGVGVIRNGNPVLLEGFITDITAQKVTENALKESEQKFRKIVESTNDAIYVIKGKEFVMVNQKFEQVFGYLWDEIREAGFTFVDLLDEDSIPIIEQRRRQRERGDKISDRIAFIGKTKTGKKLNLEASVSTIDWEGDPAVLGVLRDFTSQKQLEDQLRHSQKIEAVGRLAGGLAHDFNNILTAIGGYAELLSVQVGESEGLKNNVVQIQSAAQRATNLVQQLLAFSRRQVIQPIPVNLNDIITSMQSLLHRVIGEDIEVNTYLDEHLGTMEIDPALVEQVIMNLVINSRDAMPQGGKLTIETFNTELSYEYGETHTDVTPGRYVALAISDTGIGIAKEVLSQIYEPFFTTKERGKGTGLGLATVYGIVKQSGGHIWCYSEVERGTTFKIYFPRVDKPVEEPVPQLAPTNQMPHGTETILIVEDEESVRKLCSGILSSLGYQVLEGKDGIEGLKIFQGYGKPIHLMLTDVMMPGLNGKELSDKLLKIDPNLRVIFISGYTDNTVITHGMLEPGLTFLQKPFTPQVLAGKIREILDLNKVENEIAK
jgi:two-component system, cell cycle sensor histidine kinase and response regulator CckA